MREQGKPWLPIEDAALRWLVAAGRTVREIIPALSPRSEPGVRNRCRFLGLKAKRKTPRPKRQPVRSPYLFRKWTEQEIATLEAALQGGWCHSMIAKLLDRPRRSVKEKTCWSMLAARVPQKKFTFSLPQSDLIALTREAAKFGTSPNRLVRALVMTAVAQNLLTAIFDVARPSTAKQQIRGSARNDDGACAPKE
jgi:hypothetical protein